MFFPREGSVRVGGIYKLPKMPLEYAGRKDLSFVEVNCILFNIGLLGL